MELRVMTESPSQIKDANNLSAEINNAAEEGYGIRNRLRRLRFYHFTDSKKRRPIELSANSKEKV
jgi:hypothetical protein